jgi:EpsI family protein
MTNNAEAIQRDPRAGRPMTRTTLALMLAALMGAASVAAYLVRPSTTASTRGQSIQLDSAVPKKFGSWREEEVRVSLVVNPQTKELLDKIYSQVLTRTYVDDQGYRVMLSLAYGDDQRGGLQAHKPEVCYPAQGFELLKNEKARIGTPFGTIPGRRLDTRLGSRVEPVTYWFAVGDRAVTSRFEHRLAEIRLGLTGQVPYGLLFRVSSIDPDSPRAYRQHERFVSDLLAAVSPAVRERLSGLASEN